MNRFPRQPNPRPFPLFDFESALYPMPEGKYVRCDQLVGFIQRNMVDFVARVSQSPKLTENQRKLACEFLKPGPFGICLDPVMPYEKSEKILTEMFTVLSWIKMNKGMELCKVLAPEVIEAYGETIDNKLKNKFLLRFKPVNDTA
jgi:hypothetical protein